MTFGWIDGVGLEHGVVRIAASNPGWPTAYAEITADIDDKVGRLAVAIEHVGSTAVPGLSAKPIIDVLVGMADGVTAEQLTEKLTGYEYRGDGGAEGGLLFVLEDRPLHRLAHVHAVPYDDWQWRRYLAFRDALRNDETARNAYGQLKCELAVRFADDRPGYTAAKAEFISSLLARQ